VIFRNRLHELGLPVNLGNPVNQMAVNQMATDTAEGRPYQTIGTPNGTYLGARLLWLAATDC
jgi:hypothetical protein